MADNVERVLQQPPNLTILRTCRELRDEGRDFFYKENKFEVVFDVTEMDRIGLFNPRDVTTLYTHHLTDPMLPALHLPSIRHLHVIVVMGAMNMNGRIGIDWRVIASMINLEKLDVAIAFEGDQVTASGLAPNHIDRQRAWWKRSMFLEMMVIRILEFVPRHVDLQWKVWDTLAIDLGTWWRRWRNAIDVDRIQEIAAAYQMVRGRKVVREEVVFEGRCCMVGV